MTTQATTQWALDPTHSEIGFKVKHLMITNVSGSFEQFDASVVTVGDDFTTAQISFTAQTSSITTKNADRDTHLRSGDFFDSENYPELSFKSTKVEQADEQEYVLHGELTIKDATQPVTLQVEYGGVMKDPWGNEKAGFTISGTLNRKDWGLNWNAPLETGGVLVSEQVKLSGEIQLTKPAA